MSKITGIVGALTTFGAVAYLLAPLPPQVPSPAETNVGSYAAPSLTQTTSPAPGSEASLRLASAVTSPAAAPTPAPSLVHQIQSELQRLGCYAGQVDGQWSVATQRAMLTLGERASVLRPVDTPDYIMLALARSQASDVCARRPERGQPRSIATAPPATDPALNAVARTRSARLSVSEPVQAVPAQPWHVKVQRATRQPAERTIANRTPQTIASPATIATAPSPEPALRERPFQDQSRMALGAYETNPLRVGIDQRNPNAAAHLRGPSSAPPPATAHDGSGRTSPDVVTVTPRRTARAAEARPKSYNFKPDMKQAKRAWQRSVFTEMSLRGP